MAIRYYVYGGVWESSSGWASTATGSPPASYPNGALDSASFSTDQYPYTLPQTVGIDSAITVYSLSVIDYQNQLVTLVGGPSASLTVTNIVSTSFAGSASQGTLYADVPINAVAFIQNQSLGAFTFAKPVTTSADLLVECVGQGGIIFQSSVTSSVGVTVSSFNYASISLASVAAPSLSITTGTIKLVTGGSTPITIGVGGYSATLLMESGTQSGAIYGTGTIFKTGADTLILTEANTNSGGVTISQGTIKTGNATALGTGAVSVAAGTTLQLGSAASGKATLGGTLTINGGKLRIGG